MTSSLPRIAIPEPASTDPHYSERSWPVYARAVELAGGIPVSVPLDASQSTVAQIAGTCAAVLLPGNAADVNPEKYGEQASPQCGAKDPLRESADELLLQDAFNLHKPILGICYGLQSLNVWKNGTLIQDLPKFAPESPVNHDPDPKVLEVHSVRLTPGSRLAAILRADSDVEKTEGSLDVSVNSSHHQAVAHPGDQLAVVAVSPEDGVIEALEGHATDQFVVGVQWHPERTYDTSAASRSLFGAFIEAAKAWKPKPIHESVAR